MKRYFKTIAAAMLSVLAVAACQKENLGGAQDGREVDVNLTLTSPEIGTKAYGDGQTVNTVHVWVYQVAADGTMTYIVPAASGEAATPTQEVEMKNGTAKYSTRLVTGQKYTFVFWADYHKDGYTSPYTYNSDSKTITVDYANAAGNDEKRDAFYNVLKDVEITGAYSTDVKLYRPFAQINFGASDLAAAKNGKLDVQKAAVKLTKAATSLNLLSGTVAGEAEVTFAETDLAGGKLSVGGVDYDYLTMDYVLVGKDAKTLSDVTLSANSGAWTYTYSNVPLQGNYRTNIVGNLFTNPTTVSITVAPGFNEPGNNVEVKDVTSVSEANAAFANGATYVNVKEVSDSDSELVIVLPKTNVGVGLALPTIPSGKNLTIKYADDAAEGEKPASLKVNVANAENVTIIAPNTHVELNGVTLTNVTATTSGNTLVVGKDVTINTLKIEQGTAEIYGKVSSVVKGENAGAIFCYVDAKENAPANVDAICVKTAEGLTAYVNNQIAFESALNRADKVVLDADLELKAGVAVCNNTALDLNKHSITNVVDIWNVQEGEKVVALIDVDNCTLAITADGKGSIKAKENDCYTFNVRGSGKLVIGGGTYVGNVSVVQVQAGEVEVKGGNFSLAQKWPEVGNGSEYLINLIDDAHKDGTAKAIVSGGTFVDFDPENNLAEGKGTNFCASGYGTTRVVTTSYRNYKEYSVSKVKEVSDAESFISAINEGDIVRLTDDIKLKETAVLNSWYPVTIDMNGHKITNDSDLWNVEKGNWSLISVRKAVTLYIKGNGQFESKVIDGSSSEKGAYAIDTQNKGAKVVIADGTFVGVSHSIYSEKGVFFIEGGKYSISNENDPLGYVINCKNENYSSENAKMFVTGGEFKNFNPANNKAEGEGTNFTMDGYSVVKDSDWYKVVKAE